MKSAHRTTVGVNKYEKLHLLVINNYKKNEISE